MFLVQSHYFFHYELLSVICAAVLNPENCVVNTTVNFPCENTKVHLPDHVVTEHSALAI